MSSIPPASVVALTSLAALAWPAAGRAEPTPETAHEVETSAPARAPETRRVEIFRGMFEGPICYCSNEEWR